MLDWRHQQNEEGVYTDGNLLREHEPTQIYAGAKVMMTVWRSGRCGWLRGVEMDMDYMGEDAEQDWGRRTGPR